MIVKCAPCSGQCAVIKNVPVLRQQSTSTTHHLQAHRDRRVPDHPGHLWHNIRILPGIGAGVRRAAGTVLFRVPRRRPLRDHLPCWIRKTWDARPSFRMCFFHASPHQRALWRGGEVSGARQRQHIGIIGSRHYARGMARRMFAVRPIKTITRSIAAIQLAEVQAFCNDMRLDARHRRLVACSSGRDAVRAADIMVTATSARRHRVRGRLAYARRAHDVTGSQ